QPQNVGNSGQQYIKQETKYENRVGSYPPPNEYVAPTMNPVAPQRNVDILKPNPSAQQRSVDLLTQQFGSQANASIQAAGLLPQPRQMQMSAQQRSPHIPLPAQAQPRPPHQQYQQQHGSISTAQTDGSGDSEEMQWFDIMEARRSCSERDRIDAD